jgi:hypothetical protein
MSTVARDLHGEAENEFGGVVAPFSRSAPRISQDDVSRASDESLPAFCQMSGYGHPVICPESDE